VADSGQTLFDQRFDVNVKGVYFTYFTSQKALPLLNEGATVIINSTVANERGGANMSVYAATQGAVRSFARTLTGELMDRGIRVNVVRPGPIVTPILARTGLPKEAVDGFVRDIVAKVPMKRFGQPDEVASRVLFLATPESSYATGVDINLDEGMGQV